MIVRGRKRKAYDAHGRWFMDYGSRFDKYGFHIQKYADPSKIGINLGDNAVRNRISNSVFVTIETQDDSYVMKVTETTLKKTLTLLMDKIRNRNFRNVKSIVVYSSDNPNIDKLQTMRLRDEYSQIRYWYFTDEFKEKYGPFEKSTILRWIR